MTGRIFTFYSYKGGTGRSMALANVAWLLASAGNRVLMVDWDLEAPGLHRYFRPFLDPDTELFESPGLVDFLMDYVDATQQPEELDGETPWYRRHVSTRRFARRLNWSFPRYVDGANGSLHLLGAGRQGPAYATLINTFEWTTFYQKMDGFAFLQDVAAQWREDFDFVLIDSRTGVSDTSGICTVEMPDTLVVFFTMNNQSIEGAAAVAASVLKQRERGRDLSIIPVGSRVENAELDKLQERLRLMRTRFGSLIDKDISVEAHGRQWEELQLPAVPYYGYEEVLAVFAEESLSDTLLLGPYLTLTRYLSPGDYKILVGPEGAVSLPSANSGERRKVLDSFASFVERDADREVEAYDIFLEPDPDLEAEAMELAQDLSAQPLRVFIRRADMGKGEDNETLNRIAEKSRWMVSLVRSSSSTLPRPENKSPYETPGVRRLFVLWDGKWPQALSAAPQKPPHLKRKSDESSHDLSERISEFVDPYEGARSRADAKQQRKLQRLEAELRNVGAEMTRRTFLLGAFGAAGFAFGAWLIAGMRRFPYVRTPRFVVRPRQRQTVAFGLEPGFYRNPGAVGSTSGVLHYATEWGLRPADVLRSGATREIPGPRVRIRGGLQLTYSYEGPRQDTWLSEPVTPSNHANLSVSSLPAELEATVALDRGDAKRACDVLVWGLEHDLLLLPNSDKRPNYRLLDLLAGAASRYAIDSSLSQARDILERMRKLAGLAQTDVARLDQMKFKWSSESSWRRRWLARDKPLRWNQTLLPALNSGV